MISGNAFDIVEPGTNKKIKVETEKEGEIETERWYRILVRKENIYSIIFKFFIKISYFIILIIKTSLNKNKN